MTLDGEWDCSFCCESGNVITLDEIVEKLGNQPSSLLFNPRKERKQIRDTFDKLICKYPDDRQLKNLQQRTNQLIEFLFQEKDK